MRLMQDTSIELSSATEISLLFGTRRFSSSTQFSATCGQRFLLVVPDQKCSLQSPSS